MIISFTMDSNEKPIVDLPSLKDRLEGDRELFLELTNMFFEDYEGNILTLNNGLATNNADLICKTAHSLKGALANLSALRAAEMALELEKMGRRGELQGAGESLELFKQEIESFRDFVKQVRQSDFW